MILGRPITLLHAELEHGFSAKIEHSLVMYWFDKQLVAIGAVALLNFGSLPALASSSQPYNIIDQFAEVLSVIEEDYVEPPARDKLGEAAIAGMVGALDPHSGYMPPEQYEDFPQEP